VEKGRGWVKTTNSIQEIKPGDMFCIMNDCQIEYYDDPDDPWLYYWLHLNGKACNDLVREWGFSVNNPWLRPAEPERVIDGFKRIFAMSGTDSLPRPNALAAELFRLFDAIYNPEPYQENKSRQLVERAKAIIESQLHTSLNVTELAQALRVDRTTLFHAFRREFECSPIEYLRQQRIDRACRILSNSNRSLSDVARMCGFSNDKYFIKTFRQLKGASPRKYFNNKAEN
jgi:AraC-like DNA-binding protein